MTVDQKDVRKSKSDSSFASVAIRIIMVMIWLQILSTPPAFSAIKPGEVAIPQQLGVVQNRVEGAAGQPLIFVIGEEHISLKVQQAVADILRYLSGAYDVKLVCTEGYDKPLSIPQTGIPISAQRFAARADLNARRISGVEYFARAYPNIPVIGVEDMKAYHAHGKQLDERSSLEPEAKQLSEDFGKFITQDLANLKVTKEDAKKYEEAIEKLIKDNDLTHFTKAIYDISGRESEVGKKITDLNQRRESLEKRSRTAIAVSPEMQARDRAMVSETLRMIKDKKVRVAALG